MAKDPLDPGTLDLETAIEAKRKRKPGRPRKPLLPPDEVRRLAAERQAKVRAERERREESDAAALVELFCAAPAERLDSASVNMVRAVLRAAAAWDTMPAERLTLLHALAAERGISVSHK